MAIFDNNPSYFLFNSQVTRDILSRSSVMGIYFIKNFNVNGLKEFKIFS